MTSLNVDLRGHTQQVAQRTGKIDVNNLKSIDKKLEMMSFEYLLIVFSVIYFLSVYR